MAALAWSLALVLGHTQGPARTVEWEAPQGCPEHAGVRALADAYSGGALERGQTSGATMDARVTKADAGEFALALELRVDRDVTTEQHRDPSCEELAKLAAIKLAILLDPEGFVARYEEVEALAAETLARRDPPAESPPPPTPTAAPAEAKPRPPVEARIGLGIGPGWGQLPGPSGQGVLRIAATGRHWRAEARGLVGAFGQERLDEDPSAGLDMLSFGGGVLGCGLASAGRVVFPLCAGVEGSALRARGVGTDPAQVSTRPYVGATIGAGLSVEWSRVALFVQPETSVALSRARFAFTDGPQLYLVPPVSVRVLVGVEFRLGPRPN